MQSTSILNLDRITRDPVIMGGKPCLRGMRVTDPGRRLPYPPPSSPFVFCPPLPPFPFLNPHLEHSVEARLGSLLWAPLGGPPASNPPYPPPLSYSPCSPLNPSGLLTARAPPPPLHMESVLLRPAIPTQRSSRPIRTSKRRTFVRHPPRLNAPRAPACVCRLACGRN